MNTFKMTTLALMAILSLTAVSATSRDLSLAVEDAARATVRSLAEDGRVKGVKSIAFVKLNLPEGQGKLELDSNASQVFEATLASKAEAFTFVTHDTHAEEWKLIDGVFDQAADFLTYDPKTHPELNKLKLADALLFGQVIDCVVDGKRERKVDWAADEVKESKSVSVRIALRLLKISTGEELWGKVIEGISERQEVSRERDIRQNLMDEAKNYITFKNILIAVGCLIGLIILLVLIGKMTRVR